MRQLKITQSITNRRESHTLEKYFTEVSGVPMITPEEEVRLAKEIKEFHEDKKGVVETKVKLVAEAKKQMAKMKEAFITRSAKVVENAVNKKLAEELKALKEDITAAR